MFKKVITLILLGTLAIPFAGCDAHVSILGHDIFSYEEPKQQEEEIQPLPEQQTPQYTDDQILETLYNSNFNIVINGEEYKIAISEFITWLYGENASWIVLQNNSDYSYVKITDNRGAYVTLKVDMNILDIFVAELGFADGGVMTDNEGTEVFMQYMHEYIQEQKQNNNNNTPQNNNNNTQQKKQEQKKQESTYKCKWCGNKTDKATYDKWGGCCSEICGVQLEGTAYENYERDMLGETPAKDENMYHGVIPDGGVTICGWCGARVMGDGAFCSDVCENAHRNYYNN